MSLERPASTEPEGSITPLVSVVIPTRHREAMLRQCVGSILGQTITDIEVIVVVDGFDAATIDFLSNGDDNRLRHVVHAESRGVSNARNTGIALATGRWLAFCDDDDIWAPTKLAAQLAALRENPTARWAIAGTIRVHQELGSAVYREPPAAEIVATKLPYWNVVPGGCSGVIADRCLVTELGAFDPGLSTLADFDLWIRLNWSSTVAVAREPLVGYRDHGGAMTRRLRNVEDELQLIRQKYRDQLVGYGQPFPANTFYKWTSTRTFRTGDWRGGVHLLFRSSRFRIIVAQRLWASATGRRWPAQIGAERSVPLARRVTVTEYPWLGIMLVPEPGSPREDDRDEQQTHGSIDEAS